MIKDGNYFVVQSWMIKELKLSGNNMIIYAVIYGFCQTDGQYFNGSLSYLAEWANCSTKTVQRSLEELEKLGYINKKVVYRNNVRRCKYSCVALEEIKAKNKKSDETKKDPDKVSGSDKNLSGMDKVSCPVWTDCLSGMDKMSINNINYINNNKINSPAGQRPDKNSVKKPSREEVENYCKRCKHRISVDDFYRYYDKHGWWKDWKRAVRKWEDSCPDRICPSKNEFNKFKQNDYDFDELEKLIVDN